MKEKVDVSAVDLEAGIGETLYRGSREDVIPSVFLSSPPPPLDPPSLPQLSSMWDKEGAAKGNAVTPTLATAMLGSLAPWVCAAAGAPVMAPRLKLLQGFHAHKGPTLSRTQPVAQGWRGVGEEACESKHCGPASPSPSWSRWSVPRWRPPSCSDGFYILVWYTFSTCLTLYNKTLLGDKLGKFSASLLMNTMHFALQAGLSKLIICFQPKGPEAAVDMGWKDYFMRVVPTALGTALDINLSNASLVFMSVTFATMCKSASPIFLLLFAFAFR
ncbi:putative sugar phosphate/phosphate translocator [Zea mays]|nr:putative sugar phosphate/phosphate translocator [Zea mays]